jgi:hypothetical protein
MPFQAALRMVLEGEITDAISVAALLKIAVLAQARRLPVPLQAWVQG